MSKLEVDTIAPQSGTTITVGESGDTVTIPTGVTLDASNATTTLPANVVTTDGTQTLTNKSIAATQLTGTITPSDGTITNAKVNASAAIDYSKLNLTGNIALTDLSATGTKDATTFLRGDNTFAEAGGGVNTPIVYVEPNSGTALPNSTTTKITLDNEFIDTDNAFASSRFTVPSGKAGKYFVNFQISINHNTTENSLESLIYKNGSIVSYAVDFSSRSVAHTMTVKSSIVINLSVGDYLEFYGRQNSGSSIGTNGGLYTFVEIFKLID